VHLPDVLLAARLETPSNASPTRSVALEFENPTARRLRTGSRLARKIDHTQANEFARLRTRHYGDEQTQLLSAVADNIRFNGWDDSLPHAYNLRPAATGLFPRIHP
jgi:hypothetical protein